MSDITHGTSNHIYSFIRWAFPFQNNLKSPNSSCEMNQDFFYCFRRKPPLIVELHDTGSDIGNQTQKIW